MEDENKIQRLDYESVNLQYLYLTNLLKEERDCTTASKSAAGQIDRLNVLGSKLEEFIKNVNLDQKEFDLLKREYVLSEIRYWLISKNLRDICKDDKVSVLYFYSNDDCDECRTQGFVLGSLKSIFKDNLLIFSLDADFKLEPMLDVIKNKYNITSVPTLVINDENYSGLKNSEELLNIICSRYENKLEGCK